MSTPEEKALRTRLVDVQIELDARERWPLFHDLGWNRACITSLRAEEKRLTQQIAIVKTLTVESTR